MKQNTYRLIASILIFVLTLIFVGCNGGTEPTDPSTIPTGTTQQTQGTTAPETSTPGTSAPETTVPETTLPETTVPETTVPETTVPETTVPETTVPETTVPETTVPEITVPETTTPVETQPTVTQPPVTEPPVTEPPVTEPEEVVYVEADVANSIKIGESWINNTPEPGEATTIGRIYVFSTAKDPVCSIRSLEVVSASLNGKAAEVLQTSSKENAQAFLVNKGAAGIVQTEALLVTQIMCSLEAGEEPINFEVIIRAALENGQTLELRFIENRLQYGSGGIFAECDPEDFQ